MRLAWLLLSHVFVSSFLTTVVRSFTKAIFQPVVRCGSSKNFAWADSQRRDRVRRHPVAKEKMQRVIVSNNVGNDDEDDAEGNHRGKYRGQELSDSNTAERSTAVPPEVSGSASSSSENNAWMDVVRSFDPGTREDDVTPEETSTTGDGFQLDSIISTSRQGSSRLISNHDSLRSRRRGSDRDRRATGVAGHALVSSRPEFRALLQEVRRCIRGGDCAAALDCLRSCILVPTSASSSSISSNGSRVISSGRALTAVEANFAATKLMTWSGESENGIGNFRICGDVLTVLRAGGVTPDSVALSAAMSVYIRHHRFEEAMAVFEGEVNPTGLAACASAASAGAELDLIHDPAAARMDKRRAVTGSDDRPVESDGARMAGRSAAATTGPTPVAERDAVLFMSGVRAAGFCRPWAYTLSLLEEAYEELGNEVAPVALTAIANLKYLDGGSAEGREAVERGRAVVSWMRHRGLRVSIQAMDALLAVARAHGSEVELRETLEDMRTAGMSPSPVTFNILLNHCASRADLPAALSLVALMRLWRFAPDDYTYNTLMKLCARKNDLAGAEELLKTMKTFGFQPSGHSKSLLIKLYTAHNDPASALALLTAEDQRSVTPYMFSAAIAAANGHKEALGMLKLACKLRKADEAVFTAAAQRCAREGEYLLAYGVLETMLARGLTLNKFSLSFSVNACLDHCRRCGSLLHRPLRAAQTDPKTDHLHQQWQQRAQQQARQQQAIALQELQKFLRLASERQPSLLTNAVCQKVVRDLAGCGPTGLLLAADLHLGPLAHATCKPETLGTLLNGLQQMSEDCAVEGDVVVHSYADSAEGDQAQVDLLEEGDRCVDERESDGEEEMNAEPSSGGALRRLLAERGLALIRMYSQPAHSHSSSAAEASSRGSSDSSRELHPSARPIDSSLDAPPRPIYPRRHLLRTAHFNAVLRLLFLARRFAQAERLFRLMAGQSGSWEGEDDVGNASARASRNGNGHSDRRGADVRTDSGRSPAPSRPEWSWRPGIFTVAELVRLAREARRPLLARDAMRWAVSQGTDVPLGVISDAVSFVYQEGRTDIALELYALLYAAGQVQHWTDKTAAVLASLLAQSPSLSRSRLANELADSFDSLLRVANHRDVVDGRSTPVDRISVSDSSGRPSDAASCPSLALAPTPAALPPSVGLEVDLHNFSRGMAYAAITCALAEARRMQTRRVAVPETTNGTRSSTKAGIEIQAPPLQHSPLAGTADAFGRPIALTIITGRNIADRGARGAAEQLLERGAGDESYRLMEEVQRVLIEDFYPPISSSTVPGNPGRLVVVLVPTAPSPTPTPSASAARITALRSPRLVSNQSCDPSATSKGSEAP